MYNKLLKITHSRIFGITLGAVSALLLIANHFSNTEWLDDLSSLVFGFFTGAALGSKFWTGKTK
jgi:uncharacterized membrane protein YccC